MFDMSTIEAYGYEDMRFEEPTTSFDKLIGVSHELNRICDGCHSHNPLLAGSAQSAGSERGVQSNLPRNQETT